MYRASFNECRPLAGVYLAQTCGEGHPAQRAVAQRGQRVVVFFHQRHMLEGRGMEDHLRFGPTEGVAQVRQVFHITAHPIQWQGRRTLAQPGRVGRVFCTDSKLNFESVQAAPTLRTRPRPSVPSVCAPHRASPRRSRCRAAPRKRSLGALACPVAQEIAAQIFVSRHCRGPWRNKIRSSARLSSQLQWRRSAPFSRAMRMATAQTSLGWVNRPRRAARSILSRTLPTRSCCRAQQHTL